MTTSPKTWLPTKAKWLYRHQSGTYYARLPIRGKETWRSRRTQTLSVDRTKLEELRKDAAHSSPDARVTRSSDLPGRICPIYPTVA